MNASCIGVRVSVLISALLSNVVFAEENRDTCIQEEINQQLLSPLIEKYQYFSSLYTGGMHFKSLGTAEESLTIYLALNNEFETLNRINKKIAIENTSNVMSIDDTSAYLMRIDIPWVAEEYKTSPSEALDSALKVSIGVKPGYEHINKLGLPYSFHYRQAGFDLDIFTSVADPIDWWLQKQIPTHFSKLKEATWIASKENDFMDWLQFVTTASAIPHLQNWSFRDSDNRKSGYTTLKKHAYDKWKNSGSYAWLAALAEVALVNDEYGEIILNEFDKIAEKVTACSASVDEQAAFAMILLNAVRLGHHKGIELKVWLAPSEEGTYKNIKSEASKRLSQLILAEESLAGLRAFWMKMPENITSSMPSIRAIMAVGIDDFMVSKDVEAYDYNDVELRFISTLSVSELLTIAEQGNLSIRSRTLISRTAFFRAWVHGDAVVHLALGRLADLEPSIAPGISVILNTKDDNEQKVKLFEFVMSNPALTYLLGVELFKPQHRTIKDFSKYNAEDGSWWCETNMDEIIGESVDSTIRLFGFNGADPLNSGGTWGATYYNPGQKRASLRKSEKIVVNAELHEQISYKLKRTHALLNYSQDDNWRRFSKLPSAPVFFYQKLHALDASSDIDDATLISLYKLVIRSSRRTCRKQKGVFQVLKKARAELKDRFGVNYH